MRRTISGTGFLFVIPLLAMLSVAGVVSAGTIASGNNYTIPATDSPVIFFEGLSTPCNASYNASELQIHPSIKKYDLVTFDIPKMREKLAKNETITVRIDGAPYEIVVKNGTEDAYGIICDTTGCSGTLKNEKNSEISFVLSEECILGRIKINGTNYFFDTTPKTENGNVIQYVYSYKNVVSEGPSVNIDDVDVTRSFPITMIITEAPSTSQIPTETQHASPLISFDGLSTPSNAPYNASELKIPSSITKYELLTFDIPKMRGKLAHNETITIRINGVPYQAHLYDSTGKAEGLDPDIRSYRGSFDNIRDSEISLTIGRRVISGEFSIDNVKYFFGSTPEIENGKVIQYVYSSRDVIPAGQPTYWGNDYVGHGIPTITTRGSPTTQSPITTHDASLPVIIPLCAAGLVILGFLIRR